MGNPTSILRKKTVAMGLKFDSRWEAERWGQLKSMERAGVVDQLDRQIKYELKLMVIRYVIILLILHIYY